MNWARSRTENLSEELPLLITSISEGGVDTIGRVTEVGPRSQSLEDPVDGTSLKVKGRGDSPEGEILGTRND
jgi:hypothetical protein